MTEKISIGSMIEGVAHRDAIHIAIAPVIAGEPDLRPGTRIGFAAFSNEIVRARKDGIGIVDPFLSETPLKGQRFYMLLLPNTITSLRHDWSHPAFSSHEKHGGETAASEEWLMNYAFRVREYDAERGREYAYGKFMEDVRNGTIFYYGSDCHGAYDVKEADELYRHLSVVLERDVGPDSFEFSCSC